MGSEMCIRDSVYNETELTNTTNPLALGSPAAGIPEHQASLFVNYDFAPSEAKGLRLNAGIVYVGERLDTVPTALFQVIEIGELPCRTTSELMLGLATTLMSIRV